MKNINILLAIIFFLSSQIFMSCEKNSNIEVPDYTPKLVIHSFISPSDTILKVHVSTTKNVYGNLIDYTSALPVKVTLIDGELLVPFGERDTNGYCNVKYRIEAGKEYKIVAKCDGYPDVSASCKVPVLKDLQASFDTFSIVHHYETYDYRFSYITMKFNDFPNESNYYNIAATQSELLFENNNIRTMSAQIVDLDNDDAEIQDSKLISDHLASGGPISTTFGFYNFNIPYLKGMLFNAYVLETDENYYKYHTSLKRYNNAEDPFTEFSPVFSNIEGGFGIFSAYIRYEKVFTIK
jgi:hypothetical protein